MIFVRPSSQTPTNLVERFINFAEYHYSIDWTAVQRSVAAKLRLNLSFEVLKCDPVQCPSYWYVPLLVGNYVGASRKAVLEDTETFVTGCLIRHFMFESSCPFDSTTDVGLFRLVMDAYSGCRTDTDRGLNLPFDERFSAKCLPWMILLVSGTRSIFAEAGGEDYASAMKTIVLVHSCLQMIDDWHDKVEDAARSHWNMWIHEPIGKNLSVIEPLLHGSRLGIESMRPHLLRRILGVQLQDTAKELRDVVTVLSKTPSSEEHSLRSVDQRISDDGR